MANLTFLKQRTNLLRKLLGVIILASVGLMIYNDSFSASSFGATEKNGENFQTSLVKGLTQPYHAPEITGITHWINSTPLQINQLKGKVVLIDFWTYSCINCIRTLPYIKDWYAKYHDKGLVIIGVHTPEFEFEKNFDNVKKAVEKFGIKYAVALDSNFATWQSFSNQYWPAHYLIDKEGNVVYQHFGEGDYDVTENNIRFLLGLSETTETVTTEKPGMLLTPETYLGYERSATFYSPEKITQDNPALYTYPQTLPTDDWALKGKWSITAQRIISAEKNVGLKLHFHAKKVFIVMGSSTGKPIRVDLRLNGEKVVNEKGSDVVDSSIMVNNNTLYSVVDLPESDTAVLELMVSEPGLEVYTFTFG